jgi:hypothetical protein
MKKFIIALLIVLTSAVVIAKDSLLVGCTADQKPVSSKVILKDEALTKNAKLEDSIKDAYRVSASISSAEDFRTFAGYVSFVEHLTEEEFQAIENIARPVVGEGSCK